MANITTFQDSWENKTALFANRAYAYQTSSAPDTLDLTTSKKGAYLWVNIARYSTASLTNGVVVRVRPQFSGLGMLSNDVVAFAGGTSYCNQTLSADCAVGVYSLPYANQAYSTLYAIGDALCIWGTAPSSVAAGTAYATNFEFVRVSRSTSTPAVIDQATKLAHASGDYLTAADMFGPVWIPGGRVYDVIVDAGGTAESSGIFAVSAYYQILDYVKKATVAA